MIIERLKNNRVTAIKKGAYKRLPYIHTTAKACGHGVRRRWLKSGCCALRLTFQVQHLIFEAQLQFLQPHFL